MTILRTDIERALDELISQEEGMRFQGLAVVLGKQRWPELIACQRKKDLGLDAYVPSSQTPEKFGKGLAASITPTLNKVSDDATKAKKNFSDLKALLFVTPVQVGNSKRNRWKQAIQNNHDLELHIIEREEIITLMMMPENAPLLASFLLLGFVDLDIRAVLTARDVLVARLTELAQRSPEAAKRLRELCERDLPKVMGWIGTPEALVANLNLIDDTQPSSIPQGVLDQLENAFVERQPYAEDPNVFTLHTRASNEMRTRLFRMAVEGPKRQKSAFTLLGHIEVWRLEYGRPTDEPRHPDLASGQSWPPKQPCKASRNAVKSFGANVPTPCWVGTK